VQICRLKREAGFQNNDSFRAELVHGFVQNCGIIDGGKWNNRRHLALPLKKRRATDGTRAPRRAAGCILQGNLGQLVGKSGYCGSTCGHFNLKLWLVLAGWRSGLIRANAGLPIGGCPTSYHSTARRRTPRYTSCTPLSLPSASKQASQPAQTRERRQPTKTASTSS
jgi:hypothetical protein